MQKDGLIRQNECKKQAAFGERGYTMALVRAKFMELLALEADQEDANAFFTIGLFQ